MLDILESHINATETPQYVATLTEAHRLFEALNFTGYDLEFGELFQAFDQLEHPSAEIMNLTKRLQISLLKQFGIFINEGSDIATVEVMNKLLNSILLLEDTELVDDIEVTVLNIGNKKECVCTIFHLIDPSTSVEDLMDVIGDIIHALPERILDAILDNRPVHVPSDDEKMGKERKQYILACRDILGPTHIYEYAQVYDKMLGFDDYVDLVDGLLPEDKEKVELSVYAKELLMCAVLSNAGDGNYLSIIKAYLSETSEYSITAHTQLMMELDRLFSSISKAVPMVESTSSNQ